ncbi:MAG: hypothetical protein Q9M91_08980 [Candidatus Dojkabacteria bacterium]|nr:hypothetical protein [Candidatus Dojkabacteria bacterium]
MGKSLGNAYSLHDIEEQGFSPMHLRYFYMSGHYKKKLNFTWEALESSRSAYEKLIKILSGLKSDDNIEQNELKENSFYKQFAEAISSDINIPRALATIWEVLKSDLKDELKLALILKFDEVLGLELRKEMNREDDLEMSDEVVNLIAERKKARDEKNWELADSIRDKLRDEFGVTDLQGK